MSSRLRLAAGVFLGLAACTAPPSGQAPNTVTVEGCPVPGVGTGCLMLRAPDGQIYDITGATPAPTLDGRTVRLTGRPSDEMNVCMQGIRLAGITWTYTDPPCTP